MSARFKWLSPDLYFDLDEVGRKYYGMLDRMSDPQRRAARLVDMPWFPTLPTSAVAFVKSLEEFETIYVRDRGWVYSSKDDEKLRIPKASRLLKNDRLPFDAWEVNGQTALYGGRSLEIGPSVLVRGPHYIGEGSALYSDAKVFGPGYFGKRVRIGSTVEVRRCFFCDDTVVHARAFLEDVVTAENVTIHINVRSLSTPMGRRGRLIVPVYERGERVEEIVYEQGPNGFILLDGIQTRVGAVFGSGTIVCPGAKIYPPVFVRRSREGEPSPIIPPDVTVFPGVYDALTLRQKFAAQFEAHQL